MKKALFIEINYGKTPLETIPEIKLEILEKILKEKYSYNEVIYLKEGTTNEPTKKNILETLNNLILESETCDEIWIHYSGHSTTIIDNHNEFVERGIVPLDYNDSGFISSSDIRNIIDNIKCNSLLILDCCYGNSGFNDAHSLKILNGKFIIDDNSKFLKQTNDETTNKITKKFVSAYMDASRYEGDAKNFTANIITRRLIKILIDSNYSVSWDGMLIRLSTILYVEDFFAHIIVISSNEKSNGRNNFFTSNGSNTNLNINVEIPENVTKIIEIRKAQMEIKRAQMESLMLQQQTNGIKINKISPNQENKTNDKNNNNNNDNNIKNSNKTITITQPENKTNKINEPIKSQKMNINSFVSKNKLHEPNAFSNTIQRSVAKVAAKQPEQKTTQLKR